MLYIYIYIYIYKYIYFIIIFIIILNATWVLKLICTKSASNPNFPY